jgi:uncharacterized protein (TIGR03790 family)
MSAKSWNGTTLCSRICCCASLLLWLATAASAQSAENVAVVINDNSPDSQRIGEHYARTRALPESNVIRIRSSIEESIERAGYMTTIEGPIASTIRRAGLQDRLLYLVLTKGVPLHIAGTAGLEGTLSSVDSELTLLYRRMTGQVVSPAGKVDNPYFLGDREIATALPFSHRAHDIYLVTRIDAFTADQAISLIDKAQKPGTEGRIVLDQGDTDATRRNNQWIAQAAKRLNDQGQQDRALIEATTKPARDVSPVLGYYFGSAADPDTWKRSMGMGFVPGSIAATLFSSDARTFRQPPDGWAPLVTNNPGSFFAGSGDPLIGDLIRDGVTGVAGQVWEPFLLGAVRPDILFPAYLAGFNLAESFYLAIPTLSWKAVVIGDPLMRPFKGRSLTSAEIEDATDSRTGLPGLFARRRVAQASAASAGLTEDAVALAIRADTMLERGDKAGAKSALEQAVVAAPTAVALLMRLAIVEESDGLHPAAIARYQRVLEMQPANVIALNNLAYALAVHRNLPAEALPLAKRAASLAPQSAIVLDTWGWIEHLLGNDAEATKILAAAIKRDPQLAEMWLHAAIVSAALGDRAKAENELKEALRLDPTLEQRDETRRLRERLAALPN